MGKYEQYRSNLPADTSEVVIDGGCHAGFGRYGTQNGDGMSTISSVFDGVAYLPELDGSRDTCILQADGTEGIYLGELNLEQLRRYRESEVHGNAFRRPQKYGLLLDPNIEPPFIRSSYRK